MVILVNTAASGGTALRKWRTVRTHLTELGIAGEAFLTNGKISAQQAVCQALDSGETEFVAAGGDGTVNLLLNLLIEFATPAQLATLRLGAIGIGSSNDFHKPYKSEHTFREIPCALGFRAASPRDVGRVVYDDGGSERTRYFLINASAGATARANFTFNNPDRVLRMLKRFSTDAAILYAAVRTIFLHRNQDVRIVCPVRGSVTTPLTNFALLKNPNVSGGLSYGGSPSYDDGTLRVCLAHSMNRNDLFRLLWSLQKKRFPAWPTCDSWTSPSVALSSPEPFAVEYDGEVISTTSARFDVLHNHLRVCP